jgi:hypothetical protein
MLFQTTDLKPEAPSWWPLLLASDETGLSPSAILDLIAEKRIRGERIKGFWYACIEDLDALQAKKGPT